MGVYSAVDISADASWQPTEPLLLRIVERLGVDYWWRVTAFDSDLREDDEECANPQVVFQATDMSVGAGIARWGERSVRTLSLIAHHSEWASALSASLSEIDNALSDGFLPWKLGIMLGRSSSSGWRQQRVLVETQCSLTIASDGSPRNWPAYHAEVEKLPLVQDLRHHLTEVTRVNWEIAIIGTY